MRFGARLAAKFGVLVVAAALATACTPVTAPPPPPTPSATATGTPSPRETSLERQTRLDFEAAEKAYRATEAEMNRLFASGGADAATPALKQTSTGTHLESLIFVLKDAKADGGRMLRPPTIAKVVPGAYSPTELNLDACVDYRSVVILEEDGTRFTGKNLVIERLIVRKFGKQWKVIDGEPQSVEKFDITNGCAA